MKVGLHHQRPGVGIQLSLFKTDVPKLHIQSTEIHVKMTNIIIEQDFRNCIMTTITIFTYDH